MKLVTKQSARLGKEGGAWLKKLIDASLKKDERYFSFLGNLRNLLSGEHWKNIKGVTKEQVKMVVNLAHSHVRTLVPTLFFQNPSLDCAPTAPQHAGKEQTWNGIINNTLDKTGFAEEAKKAVLDCIVFPEGVLKDVMNKPVSETTQETKATSEPGSDGPSVWLSKGAPIHVRISPAQLIVDYLVADRDTDKARFIAVRYKKPLHELKKHPVYGKNIKMDAACSTARTPTTGNLVGKVQQDADEWDDPELRSIGDTDEQLVTIYEVWIHQLLHHEGKYECYQQMCVLLEGQDEPIRELETWEEVMGEGFDKFPVTRLVLNPIPDKNAVSELGVWQSMQMAMNWLMSRITQLVENDRQLYVFDPSKFKNPGHFKKQFASGKTRELVELADGVTADQAVSIIQPTFVGRDNYTLANMLQAFIQQVSGIGQNRRGGSGIRTATEASLVDEGTRLKTDEKVDVVQKFLVRVITKNAMMIRSLVKQSQGTQWVFRLGGDVGSVKWINFTKEDVSWLPEIRIRVNSFRKMDSLQEMQKFAGLLQSSLALLQVYGPVIRADILFSRMLEAAGIADAAKIVGDQDAQAMLQTVELAGIIAGVETPVLEAHNHPAHMQVLDAFMQSQLGQQIMSASPEMADALMQHRQQHEMMLQEVQAKAGSAAAMQNPFAAAGMSEEGNAQSSAKQQTSGDRTAVQSVPGGNGEFA